MAVCRQGDACADSRYGLSGAGEVEVEWLLALRGTWHAAAPFSDTPLHVGARGEFGETRRGSRDAAITNHDVKAVEYLSRNACRTTGAGAALDSCISPAPARTSTTCPMP